jgi:hypothetical protein
MNCISYFDKMIEGIGQLPSNTQNKFGDMIYHPKPIGKT